MFLNINLFLKHVALLIVCIGGDKLGEGASRPALLRAFIDNTTHALIGLIVGEIVLNSVKQHHLTRQEYCIFLLEAAIVSSSIDLDHFIEAKSIRLQDATNLDRRPFLHNSAICVLICILVIVLQRMGSNGLLSIAVAMALVAFSTHHIRDATRRGIWFKVPLLETSTMAIPYTVYLALVSATPHAISQLLWLTGSGHPQMSRLVEMV
ncbi:transmembrane protein 267-like [Anopheles albimanus]|uniref:Transmembrane protein 267 n=1 Tax=Anopheles albimanus TaxID=7167 RepID=A0A182FFQ1_ANOAL|nr:transmembrane protein 267-like [Anopheles albimanus]